MTIIVLCAAIVLNAAANILIKMGMKDAPDLQSVPVKTYALYFIGNIYVLSGIFSFGLALLTYSYVLSKVNLSVAYPIMTSVGFIIVVLFSVLYLSERLIPLQILGIVLIIAGVWLVASYR